MSLFAFWSAEKTIVLPSGEKQGDSGSLTVASSMRRSTLRDTTSSMTIPFDLPNRTT